MFLPDSDLRTENPSAALAFLAVKPILVAPKFYNPLLVDPRDSNPSKIYLQRTSKPATVPPLGSSRYPTFPDRTNPVVPTQFR